MHPISAFTLALTFCSTAACPTRAVHACRGYNPRKVQPLFFPSTPALLAEVRRARAAGEPLRLAIGFEDPGRGGNALTRFASNRSVTELRPEIRLTYRKEAALHRGHPAAAVGEGQ